MLYVEKPHRRFNPLTREWVLVSPHRAQRPWLGQVEKTPSERLPAYDPDCYLCPGNSRAGGKKNPDYQGTFVFDNDFPALLPPDASGLNEGQKPAHVDQRIFCAEPVSGICRVVCFSPRHDLTFPELDITEAEAVVRTWIEQTLDLAKIADIAYVQVFENKGEMMGCSNPHPHSQIWSTNYIPNQPAVELASLLDYQVEHDRCLLCDYLRAELDSSERVVASNDAFTAIVPFWAIWPFEILVISHRHVGFLPELDVAEITALADIMQQITIRYDNLFEISFPYSMGFHQSPVNGASYPQSHLHAHFYPPLLRSATVKKFMVGFEMLAMPQRDLTPETAASRLRAMPAVHYRHQEV